MWISILLGAASGMLAAVIAQFLFRDTPDARSQRNIATIVGFAVLMALSNIYVRPELEVWEARRSIEQQVEDSPALSLLLKQNPELKESFLDMIEEAVRSGASSAEVEAQAQKWGFEVVGSYFLRYAAVASDESLENYLGFLLNTIGDLQHRNDDTCVVWLYNVESSDWVPIEKAITATQKTQMHEVLNSIVLSGAEHPVAELSATEVDRTISRFVGDLLSANPPGFAEELATLARPGDPDLDRQQLCRTSFDLYQQMADLPENDRVLVFRSFLVTAQM